MLRNKLYGLFKVALFALGTVCTPVIVGFAIRNATTETYNTILFCSGAVFANVLVFGAEAFFRN